MTISMHKTPALEQALQESSVQNYVPAYGGESVGLDLYNCGDAVTIQPGTAAMIDSGLKICLPAYHMGLLLERGSVIKTTLKLRAGVVDPGYTGNIFVNLANIGLVPVVVERGKLPVQLVVVPTQTHTLRAVSRDIFDSHVSFAQRKEAMTGSTDAVNK